MNRYIYFSVLLLSTFLVNNTLKAQNQGKNFDRNQFSIMVVPYLKSTDTEGSIIKIIEGSTVIRNAISIMNKSLLDLGYSDVKDFVKEYELQKIERLIDGTEKNLPEVIIKNSAVDVYIKFEIELRNCSTSGECEMKVRVQAIDNYDPKVYADCILSSQCRRTCDSSLLLNSVLNNQDVGVLRCLSDNFDAEYIKTLENNGRTMEVQIAIKEGCSRKLNENCNSDDNQINDCIEDFVKTLAKNGKFKVIGKTDLLLRIQLKVPLVDTDGNTFNASSLSRKIRQNIRRMSPTKGKLNLEEVIRGSRSNLIIVD